MFRLICGPIIKRTREDDEESVWELGRHLRNSNCWEVIVVMWIQW